MSKSFNQVCKVLEKVENTTGRLDMTSLMGDFLKQCDIEDIQMISYLVQGRVAPMFINSEFNYSEKSLLNLIDSYLKRINKGIDVFLLRQEKGDIGDVVYEISEKLDTKNKRYTVKNVYELLWDIVNTSGTGSVERKDNLVMAFLSSSTPIEAKYFSRIVCGSMRLGLHSKTMMDVFSYMVSGDKELSDEFSRVYGVSSDIGYVASKLDNFDKENVVKELEDISVNPGFPVLSRLVERVGSFDEVIDRFGGEFLVQGKFDGLRLQIHKYNRGDISKRKVLWKSYIKDKSQGLNLFGSESSDCVVKLFTRNLEDVTDMFPEVVEDAKNLSLESFILDSEVLGWDYAHDTFLSYQTTMQRRRKYEIGNIREKIPAKAMLFDILYLNGKDLTQLDTYKRVEILEKNLGSIDDSLRVAKTSKVTSVEELKNLFDQYVSQGLEGVIVKQLTGGYDAGQRNFEWIKIKKSIDRGLVDTIDMVVVGYYYGSGRRAELGIGALLGAVYNEEDDRYDAICKVGTGISDELFKNILENLKGFETLKRTKNVVVNDVLKPDVWVRPNFVITVDADEITRDISKDKKGVGNGLSLRFPRLVEWDRDKGIENITTVKELTEMFEAKNR
ncbi:MAG: ATP-dependent DNA ligase [Clostridia bacterium]|nr:ATP-dependent DNA ligase [Clostridia bacterium]